MPRSSTVMCFRIQALVVLTAYVGVGIGCESSQSRTSNSIVSDSDPALQLPYTDAELLAALDGQEAAQPVKEKLTRSLFDPDAQVEIFGGGSSQNEFSVNALPSEGVASEIRTEEIIDQASAEEIKIDVAAISRKLALIGASQDDPVPAQFMRALMPLLAIALGEEANMVDDFDHRSDLTESERRLLHQAAEFSKRTAERLNNTEAAKYVIQEELSRLLEGISDGDQLRIAHATLAADVRGPGDYTPLERNVFLKGADHQVRLYMDFEGVEWSLAKGQWTAELEIKHEVLRSDGFKVYSTPWQTLKDTRSRKIDVYAWSLITLAGDLDIGTYVIKTLVRQPETDSHAEFNIPIDIAHRMALVE